MSSVQQVAMASVCLVAAFAFGSYINQSQIDQPTQQVDANSSDGLRSLIETELVVQQIPSSTPMMKPKLSARLPMPSLSDTSRNLPVQPDFGFNQQRMNSGSLLSKDFSDDEIPPPNDLTGRIRPTQSSLANSSSVAPKSNGLVTDAPSFATRESGESAMPVVTQRNLGNSLNLADSMRRPFQADGFDKPRPTVESAPVFNVPEVNTQAFSDVQSNSPSNRSFDHSIIDRSVVDSASSFQDLNKRSPSVIAAKPTLPERPLTPLPSLPINKEITRQPTMIRQPEKSFKTATPDQFRVSSTQRNTNLRDEDSLMPIPSVNQTVTITDPGGAFGNRELQNLISQGNWSNSNKSNIDHSDYYPEQSQPEPPQRREARLPLRSNSNAESKLTRLRDNTIQKISLRTTQFSEYVVERGDSLQSIATHFFGEPDYYLDIYLANRDRLRFPGDLREGMSIKIPIYEQ